MPLRGRSRFTDEHFYFVTTTVLKHISVFHDGKYCDILVKIIKYYQSKHGFRILGYVIMPTHFHWVVETTSNCATISDIMRDIKKYSAWDILDQLEKEKFNKLQCFKRPTVNGQTRQFWTPRFHDIILKSNAMLRSAIDYIHYNPVVAGLVSNPEDYLYSSARNYILNDHSILSVDTDYLA